LEPRFELVSTRRLPTVIGNKKWTGHQYANWKKAMVSPSIAIRVVLVDDHSSASMALTEAERAARADAVSRCQATGPRDGTA
jgi:hypothetical protein